MTTSCNLNIAELGTPGLCESTASGIRRLLYVPRIDVECINAQVAALPSSFGDHATLGSPAMNTRALTLREGCEVAEVFASRNLGELKYTVQGSVTGNRSFRVTLEIHHPSFRKRILAFLGIAANLDFILLALTENGEWHLLGDLDRGATLADGTEATSGKATTDQGGTTLTFEHDTPMPRVMYDGWSPDDPTRGVEMWRVALLLSDNDGFVLADNNGTPFEFSWR